MSVSQEEEKRLNDFQTKINGVLPNLDTVTSTDTPIAELISAMNAVTTNLSDDWQTDKDGLLEILTSNKNHEGFTEENKIALRTKLETINTLIDTRLSFVPLIPRRGYAIGPGAVRSSGGKKRYKKQRSKRRKNKRNRKTIRRKH